jgi:hypothetical protein
MRRLRLGPVVRLARVGVVIWWEVWIRCACSGRCRRSCVIVFRGDGGAFRRRLCRALSGVGIEAGLLHLFFRPAL